MDDAPSSSHYATDTHPIDCPYCGERFEIIVDLSVVEQSYIEDCYVCCRPIQLSVFVSPTEEEGGVYVVARNENEC